MEKNTAYSHQLAGTTASRRHTAGCHSAAMKADLQSYLKGGRDALLWKLEGLSEYDIRRPMVPTAPTCSGW